MYVPITSEVTIHTGTVLKEVATGQRFHVSRRLKNNPEVWSDDPWEIIKISEIDPERKAIGYIELTEKYLMEAEE